MNFTLRMVGVFLLSLMVTSFNILFANEKLWKKLQTQKNLVVLMRHAHPKIDSGDPLHWDKSGNCKNERILSNKGKEYAKKIGEIIKNKKIDPVVISSPMCRTIETAKLVFGNKFTTNPKLREIASASNQQYQSFVNTAKKLLVKNRGNRPIFFISHRPNIEALSFELISVTQMIVARVEDNGEIEVIGLLNF